jgi:zinc/manganese transport system permease protein
MDMRKTHVEREGPAGLLLPRRRIIAYSGLCLGTGFFLLPAATRLTPFLPDSVSFMALPFLACLVLTGIHTYLGIHVITREVIFVDLSLAQIAALGTTFAFLIGYGLGSPMSYIISLTFTFMGAAVFALSRFREREASQEAVIGIAYACASALTVLVISNAPHGAEHIKDMLAGSILWAKTDTVIHTAKVYSVIGVFHIVFAGIFLKISEDLPGARARGLSIRFWDFLFYVSFGFVITSSVAIAGVLLVFSFLVIPAAISVLFTKRMGVRLAIGWVIGTIVSVAGLVLSYTLDFSSGPAVVALLGVSLAVAAFLAGIRHGGGKEGSVVD